MHIAPHPVFSQKGKDLTVKVPITFAEAALGTTVSVPTLDGKPVNVKVPAGTRSGRVFRVSGQGVPAAGKTGRPAGHFRSGRPGQAFGRREAGRRGPGQGIGRMQVTNCGRNWELRPNESRRATRRCAGHRHAGAARRAAERDQTWPSMSSPWRPSWPASTHRPCAFTSAKAFSGPARTLGGSRRYSDQDIELLRRIQDLTSAGLNLEGVKRVIELEAEVARLQQELAQARAEAREAVDQVHRHYRRDLVPLDMNPVRWLPDTGSRTAQPVAQATGNPSGG